MPFGLANALSLFQNFINNILHGILDKFCISYINDILIYSNFKKKHQTHIQKVFVALQKTKLQANIEKYEFYITKISYLELIISIKNIHMDHKKIETVQN